MTRKRQHSTTSVSGPEIVILDIMVGALCLMITSAPLLLIVTSKDDTGPLPIIFGVILAFALFIFGLSKWNNLEGMIPFLFFFTPLPLSVLGLVSLIFCSGGPMEFKGFYAPETRASIHHDEYLDVDQLYVYTDFASQNISHVQFVGQIEPQMEGKIHPENFASGVNVEPLGFAEGSRTKVNILDRIVDMRRIVIRVTGANGERVNAIIPASLFKDERISAEIKNKRLAAHPPEEAPVQPLVTSGMTPFQNRTTKQ